MPSPILARADALMQRRRQGQTGPLDDVPVLTDTVELDDAPPVLVAPVGTPPPALARRPLEPGMLDIVALELASRIEARIATELPALIDACVRDFLAERTKIAQIPDPD